MADTAVTDLDVLAASLDHLARRFREDEADERPPNVADRSYARHYVPW